MFWQNLMFLDGDPLNLHTLFRVCLDWLGLKWQKNEKNEIFLQKILKFKLKILIFKLRFLNFKMKIDPIYANIKSFPTFAYLIPFLVKFKARNIKTFCWIVFKKNLKLNWNNCVKFYWKITQNFDQKTIKKMILIMGC